MTHEDTALHRLYSLVFRSDIRPHNYQIETARKPSQYHDRRADRLVNQWLAMKHMITALLAFAAFLSVFGDEARTNAPRNKVVHPSKGTRIWISFFAIGNPAATLSTGQSDWPLVDGTKCSPDIPLNI